MDISKKITEYIVNELAFVHNRTSIEPDADLLSQGIIDSMSVIRLVGFMEEKFGIQVSDVDIVPDYFRDINSLTKLVESKLQK
jgi:acyl carrier protein